MNIKFNQLTYNHNQNQFDNETHEGQEVSSDDHRPVMRRLFSIRLI